MAVLTINGQKVTVSDSFRDLSPEEQEATVNEIAASMPASSTQATEPAQQQPGGYISQGLSGFNEGVSNLLGLPAAATNALIRGGSAASNAVLGTDIQDPYQFPSLGDTSKQLMTNAGMIGPESTEAGPQIARRVGQEIGASMVPAMGLAGRAAAPLQSLGAAGASAVGAGLGGGAVEQIAPDSPTAQAVGAIAGSLAPGAALRGAGAISQIGRAPKAPTLERINELKNAAYQKADEAGVIYTPQASESLQKRVIDSLTNKGYDPALQPGAAAVLKRLNDIQGQNVTLQGYDTLRKVAGGAYIPGNKANNAAVKDIVGSIDGMLTNPKSGDVLTGSGNAGASALREARGYAQRAFKMDELQTAVARAEMRASSTGSGGNADNAIRQNVRRILEKGRGFTKDETKALTDIVAGTPGQNALRLAGKFAPTGVVSAVLSSGAGFGVAGPAGLALPLAGQGAKAAADQMTRNRVTDALNLMATGGNREVLNAAPTAATRLSGGYQGSLDDVLSAIYAGQAANQAGGQ